ncbi:hypothetical protein WMF28_01900 [Sorangium sp. So ce590]|uniref:hypothetical protein n=1 Tax=Sorangium sp. So ce590 TaxID=3133317 RepID=UPI003F5EA701
MSGVNSPYLNRELHDSVGIGSVNFPPNAREGVAIVEVSTAQKVDTQKASGTDKAKTKLQGKEPVSVKITFRFTYRIYDEVQEMLAYLDPNGPNGGGPFAIVHPKAQERRVTDIIIEKMTDRKNITPCMYEVTIEAKEWNPAPKEQAFITRTPKISEEWRESLTAAVGKGFANSGLPASVALGGYDGLVDLGLAGPRGPDDKP